ncbi:MAG: phosphonate C-P lyase system protein PhnG [Burkholderiales bacterium]|nr:phosphonate C-P lyase system protein PhnG [Burkholderiales bacterium]
MTDHVTLQETRQHWLSVLARAPREQLEREVARLAPPAHQLVRAPECGTVMLRGRAGGTGDAFHLGEATVTRCAARIGAHLGIGYVLGRDRRCAELIAVLDALLQDPGRRSAILRQVVEPMERDQGEALAARSRMAAASRVEFFTMVRGEA